MSDILGGLVGEGIKQLRGKGNSNGGGGEKFSPTTLQDGTQAQTANQGAVTAVVAATSVTVFRDNNNDKVNDVAVKATRGATGDTLEYTELKPNGRTTTTQHSALAGILIDSKFNAGDKKFSVDEASVAAHVVDAATPPPAATPPAPTKRPRGASRD